MRMLIESLKRLYLSNKLSKLQIEERLKNGVISPDEYDYINKR